MLYAYFESTTRYYQLHCIQDLLGDWVIVANYGGLKNSLNGQKTYAYETQEAATLGFEKHLIKRLKRGYKRKTGVLD